MSNGDTAWRTDFDAWLSGQFAETGPFTALAVLVEIGEMTVTPICSTFFHVIGDEVEWADIVDMFGSSGHAWDGAAFFPTVADDEGPIDNATARARLQQLRTRLDADRLVLNQGHFFDRWGRRMEVEEMARQ